MPGLFSRVFCLVWFGWFGFGFVVLGIKLRALPMLGECSTTDL
jgi:hypothetical protein